MNRWINGLGLWLISVSLFAMPSSYGPTTAKEDLWHVAQTFQKQAPHISVQQWMLALFKQNPSAFKQHNMNGLMAGFTLQTPSAALIRTISPHTAGYVLAKHNQAWKQGGTALLRHAVSWPFAKTNNLRAQVASLDQRMSALNQSFVALQKHLESQYGELSLKAKRVQQNLAVLNSDLGSLHKHASSKPRLMLASANTDWANVWDNTKSQWLAPSSLKVASVAAFLLVLMMIWILWAPRAQAIRVHHSPYADTDDEDDDLGDEYDFMSSEEGVPARLDLAQAYMDMDDTDSAKSVLQKILASDTDARYAAKAKTMLNHLGKQKTPLTQ